VKHRDPASDAALQRYRAEQRERGRRWQRLIASLIQDFDLPDRDELVEVLGVAEMTYQFALLNGQAGQWALQEADDLDELCPTLWKTVDLLRELERALAIQLAGGDEIKGYAEVRKREDELRELRNRLADVARAAASIPRRRRKRGKRRVHVLHSRQEIVIDYEPLRALMDVLAGYWRVTLGRPFRQNQTAWEPDGSPMGKAPAAVRFAYAVIEHIAPGRGQTLGTIAREYVSRRKSTRPIVIVGVPD
jgi:hypothetical protein